MSSGSKSAAMGNAPMHSASKGVFADLVFMGGTNLDLYFGVGEHCIPAKVLIRENCTLRLRDTRARAVRNV